jgi:hypothetical protein
MLGKKIAARTYFFMLSFCCDVATGNHEMQSYATGRTPMLTQWPSSELMTHLSSPAENMKLSRYAESVMEHFFGNNV